MNYWDKEKTDKPAEAATAAFEAAQQGATGKLCNDKDAFEAFTQQKKSEGVTGYIVSTNISQDDDMDDTLSFLFREPKPASYDRYSKTASQSPTKAMRTFVLDNICEEQKRELDDALAEWPALGISLGEKLLYMLGLSKTTSVKRL